jgi:hypothetical protein
MKESGGSEKLTGVGCEAWRPMDVVRNGCGDDKHFLYRWGGGRQHIKESDLLAVVMLERDVNLYCCPARRSRYGDHWSCRGLHRQSRNDAQFTRRRNLNDYCFRNEQMTKKERKCSLRG